MFEKIEYYSFKNKFQQRCWYNLVMPFIHSINKSEISKTNSYINYSKEILEVSISDINDAENYFIVILQENIIDIYVSSFFMYSFTEENENELNDFINELFKGEYVITSSPSQFSITWKNKHGFNKTKILYLKKVLNLFKIYKDKVLKKYGKNYTL